MDVQVDIMRNSNFKVGDTVGLDIFGDCSIRPGKLIRQLTDVSFQAQFPNGNTVLVTVFELHPVSEVYRQYSAVYA